MGPRLETILGRYLYYVKPNLSNFPQGIVDLQLLNKNTRLGRAGAGVVSISFVSREWEQTDRILDVHCRNILFSRKFAARK